MQWSGGFGRLIYLTTILRVMMRSLKILRSLIREEIGHNFKTKDNDPYQYYETTNDVQVEIYPVQNGYTVEIGVPDAPELSSHARIFPTEAECTHFARQYVEYVRREMQQKSR